MVIFHSYVSTISGTQSASPVSCGVSAAVGGHQIYIP